MITINEIIDDVTITVEEVTDNITVSVNGSGKQNKLTAGTNITIDETDPLNPVISSSGSGGGGGSTDLTYTPSSTNGIVVSSTGTDATLPLADATNAGLLKPAKYTVLENTTGTNTGDNATNSQYSGLAASKEDAANKNQNNGYCGLDSGGKVPISNLPTTLLKYQGVWNASTNTPTLTNPDTTKIGNVYNVAVAGTQFGIAFNLGDWLIYNASGVPEKSDNSDDVVSVNGQTGVVTITKADLGLGNVDNTSDANKPISTATQTALDLKANSIATPLVLTLASNFSTTSTTRADVTGMSFAVTAGKKYKITLIGDHQTDTATTGGSIGFVLPSGTGTIKGFVTMALVATTVAGATDLTITIRAINNVNTTAGSFILSSAVNPINSPHYFTSALIFDCLTTGVFQLQYGSEVAASAAQMNAGSVMIVETLN